MIIRREEVVVRIHSSRLEEHIRNTIPNKRRSQKMKKMKTFSIVRVMVSILLICSVLIFWCNPAAARTVVFGTNVSGSLLYIVGAALGDVIDKNSPLKVELLPQTPTTWYPMMQTGEVDIGIIGGADAFYAYLGRGIYEEPTKGKGHDISLLYLGGPLRSGFFAAKEANINTLEDLKGKKVVTNYGSFFAASITAKYYMANAGLTNRDVIEVSVSNIAEGARAVKEGRADAAISAIGAAATKELNIARPVRLLPVNTSPEAVARAKQIFPGVFAIKVKPGSAGVEVPTTMFAIPMYIFARGNMDDSAVYEAVKATWQNIGKLPSYHGSFRLWKTANFARPIAALPYHKGAIKWYKEQGVWTEAMEKRQREILDLKK